MKRLRIPFALTILALAFASDPAESCAKARVWSDATGNYTLEAELVAANSRSVVLKRADHELVAFPIDKLSDEDRKFLESAEAHAAEKEWTGGLQTWTLRDGTKIVGRLVDYASGEKTIERRRRRIYVNDRALNNLPEFYQQIVVAIVAHNEGLPRADRRALQTWIARQGGRPKTFKVEGVVLVTENGDEYVVPFFLFSDADLAVIQAGWNEWQAAHGGDNLNALKDQSFLVRSLAAARQRDQDVKHEIALMKLQLQAVQVGLTSLWEVTLFPAASHQDPPLWVVVPGRDSNQAIAAALQMNPGYVAGPVRRVSRSRR